MEKRAARPGLQRARSLWIRHPLVRVILLELTPLIALTCAIVLFAIGSALSSPAPLHVGLYVLAAIVGCGFALSGLGWFSIRATSIGWAMLAGRGMALLIGFLLLRPSLMFCESHCKDTSSSELLSVPFLLVVILGPVVSAAAVALVVRMDSLQAPASRTLTRATTPTTRRRRRLSMPWNHDWD